MRYRNFADVKHLFFDAFRSGKFNRQSANTGRTINGFNDKHICKSRVILLHIFCVNVSCAPAFHRIENRLRHRAIFLLKRGVVSHLAACRVPAFFDGTQAVIEMHILSSHSNSNCQTDYPPIRPHRVQAKKCHEHDVVKRQRLHRLQTGVRFDSIAPIARGMQRQRPGASCTYVCRIFPAGRLARLPKTGVEF
jgi:hypothetical protein